MSAEPTSPPVEPDAPGGVYVTGLRVVLTGTQLISGFLLAVAFQSRFKELDPE